MHRKILFLVPYPLHESPSQRFRFEQYFDILQRNGYEYQVQSFLNSDNWRIFFSNGSALSKLKVLALGFAKRIKAIFDAPMYEFVFIHREAAPIGPPFLEWILAKVLRKKIIYDFDDAIWLTDRESESWILKLIKWRSKVSSVCRWAYKVSCGNEYLCSYARQFNKNAIYNPTTIDTENLHNPARYEHRERPKNMVRIGWTGSHSTIKYLQEIETVLSRILRDHSHVELMVIANTAPSLPSISDVKFISWNEATEIKDLLQFDIGIMPLPDEPWTRGKCGFKALQYMSLEYPAIASPVGVNTRIINQGVNGFLCDTQQEWEQALRKLIADPGLRNEMGKIGRRTVVENYSVLSNASNFLSLFEVPTKIANQI